jgi:response regulator RpfG family c-di-GMP phosphodiesterase
MKKLLIVDDNQQSLYLLQVLLTRNGFEVETATNGAEALEMARRAPPEMIISDILMPVMDGFALCRAWKTDERLKDIPFVFYTATYTDPKDEDFALSLGAKRFITKPSEQGNFLALLREVIEEREISPPFEPVRPAMEETDYYQLYNKVLVRKLEDKMLALEEMNRALGQEITVRKRTEEQLQHTLDSLRKAINTTIQAIVSVVEARDPYTSGHQNRSADLACAIAVEMGLPEEKIEGIRMVGKIHDIGKLSIPVEILSKPRKLSEIEFSLIKEHARKGFEMLKDVGSPYPLAEIVYQHHERMDGSGYPRNLKGEEILMEARILTVADVVEAMASHRPYRPALGLEKSMEEIECNRGVLYDPEVVDACLRLFREKGFAFN